jgi:hypothetical protein
MADKLVDMKFTKAEAKAQAEEYSKPSPDNEPSYPWGLEIRLEDESLAKLGIKTLPEIGAEFHLSVVAMVKSASESRMASGRVDRCVCLQITMMGVDLEESAAEERGEKSTPASEAAETRQPSRGGVMGRS